MNRIALLLAIINVIAAQMTFTDNWDKRALSNLFRGWQRDDLYVFFLFVYYFPEIIPRNF